MGVSRHRVAHTLGGVRIDKYLDGERVKANAILWLGQTQSGNEVGRRRLSWDLTFDLSGVPKAHPLE